TSINPTQPAHRNPRPHLRQPRISRRAAITSIAAITGGAISLLVLARQANWFQPTPVAGVVQHPGQPTTSTTQPAQQPTNTPAMTTLHVYSKHTNVVHAVA